MKTSWNGHLDIVRTLLDGGGDINAKSNVRNQMMMMMMMIIIILLTILIKMMIMMMIVVINDEDGVDCI